MVRVTNPIPNPNPNPNPSRPNQALLEMQISTKPAMKDGTPYRSTQQMFDHISPLDLP